MIIDGTPVEVHYIREVPVLVKREDLCCPLPGPSFSKIRGVYAHIKARPEEVIGVLDTFHSKAGWAVSYICSLLGKRAVNFWPRYVGVEEQQPQQLRSQELGAELVELKAGMSAVLYHLARRHLRQAYPGAYLMPNALKLPESVTENAREAARTTLPRVGTLVVSISSGTVASGVVRGLLEGGHRAPVKTVFHMGYSRSVDRVRDYMEEQCALDLHHSSVEFVDEGYSYADRAKGVSAPFPCNPYYDLKAWGWLQDPGVVESLPQPVLFWNIGE